MAVSLYNAGTSVSGNTGTTAIPAVNCGGSNRAILILAQFKGDVVSGVTATWDAAGANQPMTLIRSWDAGAFTQLYMFGLVGAAVANSTVSMSYAAGSSVRAQASCWNDVNQSSVSAAFGNGADASGSSTTPQVTIASATGDITVAHFVSLDQNLTTINDTTLYPLVSWAGARSGANYANGAANVTLDCSAAIATNWYAQGINIGQVPVAVLTATNLTVQPPTLGQPALVRVLAILATSFADSPPTLGSGTLGQKHVLAADILVDSSPTLVTGQLGQKQVLGPATNVAVQPLTFGTPVLAITRVLTATSKAVGSLIFSAPVIGQRHALIAEWQPRQPLIDIGVLGQKHVLVKTDLATPSPTIGVGVLSLGKFLGTLSFATASPTFSAPALLQKHVFVAVDKIVSPPVLGVATPPQFTHTLAATSFEVSAPIITSAAMLFAYTLHAENLAITAPTFAASPIESIEAPVVWLRHRLMRWSNDPNDFYYDEDGTENEGPVQQAIFTNKNDDIELSCSMLSLVGRTSPGRGPAEIIQVAPPLYLFDRQLLVDIAQLAEDLAGLEVVATLPQISGFVTDLNLLNDKILTETAARKTADADLDARLTVLETRSYVDRGGVEIIEPSAGFVYQVADNTGAVILNSAGNLSSGTFKLPITPTGRQKIDFIAIKSVNNLTFLTDNVGHALANPPSGVTGGKCITAVFGPTMQTWLFFA